MNKFFALFVTVLCTASLYGQIELKKLSLAEALELGLNTNPEIKSAMEQVRAAKARFWSGISLPRPEIGVSYEYTPLNSGLHNFSERSYEARQSFEFPATYFFKGKKLNQEEDIANYKLEMVKRNVIRQIKTGYFNVLAKKYHVKTTGENLAIAEDFFKKAEIRYNVGEGTNLERLTARVQFIEAQNRLEVAKNELKTAIAELQYALGAGNQNPDPDFALSDSLVFIDHDISPGQIYTALEQTNPQLKIAWSYYGIAAVDKALAWSSLLPDINLAYFRQTRDGDNGFYGASLGISFPLWFMLDQRGKIQEANANRSLAGYALQLNRNEVNLRLKSAFTDHENNLKQVKLYVNELLPQAEEIYRIAVKSYQAGELSYLEYLLAGQTLINSRSNYIDALFNHYQSIFRIEEITGQNITEQSGTEE